MLISWFYLLWCHIFNQLINGMKSELLLLKPWYRILFLVLVLSGLFSFASSSDDPVMKSPYPFGIKKETKVAKNSVYAIFFFLNLPLSEKGKDKVR